MSEKPVPIFTARVGSVKAAVWENKSEEGKISRAVSLTRSYKDENERWQETNSYFPDDLPKVRLAVQKAYEFIHCGKDTVRQPETFAEKVSGEGTRRKGTVK